MKTKALTVYDKIFIDNEFIAPEEGEVFHSINPATGKEWAQVAKGSEADIEKAVQSSRKAFNGEWKNFTGTDRAKLLRKLGDLVLENKEMLSTLETTDNGKLYKETLNGEVPSVAEWFYYYAGLADKLHGDYIPQSKNLFTYTKKNPVGVIGAIIPWNSPLLMVAWKVGPAIAAGNTIIIKPAEQTSVTALEFGKLVVEAGFPKGVINIVTGFGNEVGAALSAHPDVDKLAFTGSGSTAKKISENSLVNFKRLSFELGGKAPHIIFEDADLEQALIAAVSGIFINAGQTCAAGARLLVQESIFNSFVEKLVAKAKTIKVGNPMDEANHMGPQTMEEQLIKIENYVQRAREDGADILIGGKRAHVSGYEKGYYYEPTIISNVSNEDFICQEEVFGPVLTVVPFKDEQEAIDLANDVRYGLTAGLWTNDIRKAHRVADEIESGIVWINTYRSIHWSVPFGGVKESGYGRENGLDVIDLYTETKAIMVDLSESRADPYI